MIFLLDKDVQTVKWNGLPLHEASSAILSEQLNGEFMVTVHYPITDSGIYRHIKEDMILKVPTPTLGEQLFRIKKPTEHDDSIDVTAYHISEDIMRRSISPLSVEQQSCGVALTQLVQQSKISLGNFSLSSPIMKQRTFHSEKTETLYKVLMDGAHSILGTWEGELVRDNFSLTIKECIGEDRGVVITTHRNLKSYQRSISSQSIITRIHARSTFKPEGANEETTIRVTVDSPLISHYPYVNEVEYENNNLRAVEELRQWAESKFRLEGIDKPSDQIKVESYELDGQIVHLGDRVSIKSWKHDVDIQKRAIAYEYNCLTKEYVSLTFDDTAQLNQFKSEGISRAVDAILSVNEQSEERAIQLALDNANKAFEREFDKQSMELNDSLERYKAEAQVYSDGIHKAVSQKVGEVQAVVESNTKRMNEEVTTILNRANASIQLATEAKTISQQAKSEVATVLAKAVQFKNEAISEATRLDTVERQAVEDRLGTLRNQVQTETSRLLDTAKALLQNQISSLQTEVTQTKGSINLLASKSDLDKVKERLFTSEATLLIQGAQIAGKVNQTVVDGISQRIRSAESTLQQQATEINQRVRNQDFNQASQRLISAESSIQQLGNRITTEIRETKAAIPTTVGSRNYAEDYDFNRGLWEYTQGDGSKTDWRIEKGIYSLTTSTSTWHQLQIHSESGIRKGGKSDSTALLELSEGDTYTLSVEVKCTSGSPRFWIEVRDNGKIRYDHVVTHIGGGDTSLTATNEWKRFSLVGTIKPNSDFGHRRIILGYSEVGSISFRKVELTRGKVSTDAGPAPEDVGRKVEEAKTSIEETADGIRQLSTRIGQADGKISQAETRIHQLIQDVSSRVRQTDYDSLRRTVMDQSTTLKQTQDALQLKAEKRIVDALQSTATDALSKAQTNLRTLSETKAALQITNQAIETKVSKSDLQSTNQRLSQAETSIRTQAGQIEQRLTRSQLESTIQSKGYMTQTAVQQLVEETADGFRRTLSATSSQIPQTVSHRNLAIGSQNSWSDYQIKPSSGDWIIPLGRILYGDSTGISGGSKVHVYVCVGADGVQFDSSSVHRIVLESRSQKRFSGFGPQFEEPSPFHQAWNGELKSGDTIHLIKITRTIPVSHYFSHKDFDIRLKIEGVHSGKIRWKGLMVSTGDLFPDYWTKPIEDLTTVSALNEVKDSVASHSRTISEQGRSISQVLQTANGMVSRVSSLESNSATKSSLAATQSQVSQLAGSYAIRNLTSAGALISGLNLGANGVNRLTGKLTHITNETLLDNAVIKSAMVDKLKTANFEAGSVTSIILASQSVTADKMVVDQAFFNKLMANDAYLRQLFAKSAFISQVQAVTLSANKISGGILTATNGAMKIDLGRGNIKFFTNSPSISREISGYPHQWVSFETGTSNGRPCGVTVIGSNRWSNWNSNDGGFVGLRAWNGANDDQLDLVGDTIRLASSAHQSSDGWTVKTIDSNLRIAPYNRAAELNSRIEVGDIWLLKGNGTYTSLKAILNSFNGNFSKGPSADSYTYYPSGF